jgi:hypothetical protein
LLNTILGSLSSGVAASTSSYESIASYTASGGESSFTFSSVPATYVSLELRCLSRRSTGVSHVVALRFNADSGNNYWWHLLEGNGSTVTASSVGSAANRAQTFWPNPSVNLAGQFGAGIISIHDYASTTKYKTVRTFGGGDANGTGLVNLSSGLWSSTSAINEVYVYFLGDTVVAGSTFALYGIKG